MAAIFDFRISDRTEQMVAAFVPECGERGEALRSAVLPILALIASGTPPSDPARLRLCRQITVLERAIEVADERHEPLAPMVKQWLALGDTRRAIALARSLSEQPRRISHKGGRSEALSYVARDLLEKNHLTAAMEILTEIPESDWHWKSDLFRTITQSWVSTGDISRSYAAALKIQDQVKCCSAFVDIIVAAIATRNPATMEDAIVIAHAIPRKSEHCPALVAIANKLAGSPPIITLLKDTPITVDFAEAILAVERGKRPTEVIGNTKYVVNCISYNYVYSLTLKEIAKGFMAIDYLKEAIEVAADIPHEFVCSSALKMLVDASLSTSIEDAIRAAGSIPCEDIRSATFSAIVDHLAEADKVVIFSRNGNISIDEKTFSIEAGTTVYSQFISTLESAPITIIHEM
jgi:hypothetical protein